MSGISILAVSRLTRLTADTIRAWEKRYSAVRPARGAGGQRLFSEEDVSRLMLLREAVDAGESISHVARLSTAALRELLHFDRRVGNDLDSPIEHLLRLVDAYDVGRLRACLLTIGATHGAVEFADGIVSPLVDEIAFASCDAHVRVAKQTMLIEVLHSISAQLLERHATPAKAPYFIAFTFPHEAPSPAPLLAALVAAEAGFRSALFGRLAPAELHVIAGAFRPLAMAVHVGNWDSDCARMFCDVRGRVAPATVLLLRTAAAFVTEDPQISSMRELSDVLLGLEREVEDHAGVHPAIGGDRRALA